MGDAMFGFAPALPKQQNILKVAKSQKSISSNQTEQSCSVKGRCTFCGRDEIRQRELLGHMTEVIVHVARRSGKGRRISWTRFSPPVLLLCLPFSVLPSLFLSLCCCVLPACAPFSLAHSLSDSLLNGGHEKKAGTRGILWHHR